MTAAVARVRAEGLTVALRDRPVLTEVSLNLPAGQLIGLIGPNGAGKTTLLRALAGLVGTDAGQVWVDDTPLDTWSRPALARRLAYLPQRGVAHWPLTVRRLVLLGRLPYGGPWRGAAAADRDVVDRVLARLAITPLADRAVSTLSGGEAALALLARVLAVQAPILLVDEPVAALDPYHQLQVMELLREEARTGTAVLAVLHDLSLASRFCDGLVLLDGGRIAAQGPAASVLASDAVAATYRVSLWRGGAADERFVLPWRRLPDPLTRSAADRNRCE